MERKKLVKDLNKLLEIWNYSDYGPNGLQIEGEEEIKKIAFAVSATKDSIQKSIEAGADTLIVHHGLFWRFHGPKTITGAFANRVKPLIQNNMNLIGYHLPLDAHIEIGNAKSLGDLLGLNEYKPFGDHKGSPTGVWGKFKMPLTVKQLEEKISKACEHIVITSTHNPDQEIKSLGIITGGANDDWSYCERLGIDAYLTGEMSEHNWNEAKESEITMFAAGHHATEKFGIQSLQKHIQDKYKLETIFIDSQNPA